MADYRVGQVSGLVGVAEGDFDPALASMFGGSSTSRGRKVAVIERRVKEEPALPPPAPIKVKPPRKGGDGKERGGRRKSFLPEVISTAPIDSFLRMGKNKLAQSMKAKNKKEIVIVPKSKKVKKVKQQKKEDEEEQIDDDEEEQIDDDEETPIQAKVTPSSLKKKIKKGEKKISMEDNDDDSDSDEDQELPKKSKTEESDKSGDKKTLVERNAPKDKNPELEARTIYIGNVPKELSKKKLEKMFKEFGKVETVRLRCAAPDKPTTLKKVAMNKKQLHPDRNSVAGYIRFSTREEAENAQKNATGMEIMDHHLTVDLADNSLKRDNRRGIFVGNLQLRTQDDELWEFFEDCGKIESVRVVRDRASGLGKGFGYVNFEDAAAVELALKKEGTELRKRAVRVSRCVKKLKVKDKETKVKRAPAPVQQEYGAAKRISMKNMSGNSNTATENSTGSKKTFSKFSKGKKVSQGSRQRKETFSGDMTAEIGKFKRNSKKPNKVEMKKARFAQKLSRTIGNTPKTSNAGNAESKAFGKKGKPKHAARKRSQVS